MGNAYSRAGVDVSAGYEVVGRIKTHAARTKREGTMGALGGFGGCFDLSILGVKEPVLVSGTDGVGTKLLVAQQADSHRTIGIDCVAMCVNDIVAQGAEPLYFLDYIATGKTVPGRIEEIVAGIADGCEQAAAALIGGETAEMPGLYREGEYDLAGFAVGIAEKSQIITGNEVRAGDVLIGLPSSGLHSNGYSLVRKVFFEQNDFTVDTQLPELSGKRLADVLLEPTRIYVLAMLPLIRRGLIKGAAHITGGGFIENLPRMMPEGLKASVDLGSWPVPPIFTAVQTYGQIPGGEMYEIFNMGLGMVLAVRPDEVEVAQDLLGTQSYVVGSVKAGSPGVEFR